MKISGILEPNRNALITGASAGIGAEFARRLHSHGMRVILVARREDLLHRLADDLNRVRPGSARALAVDLAAPQSHAFGELLWTIASEQVDLLVNNAGFGSFGEFESLPLERELRMISLNIEATTRLAHAVIPQMKVRRAGGIITLSSVAGIQPIPYMATYAATKAFNLWHSLALHYELRGSGVRVLAVCPGPVDTEFGGVARVPGTASGGIRDAVTPVVEESLKALERGLPWVIPCMRAKLLSLSSRFLPRTVCTWVLERMLRDVLVKSRAGEKS